MGCYFVAHIKMKDASIYQKYLDACDQVFSKFKGTYVAVDDAPRLLEGNYDYSKTVIIHFESEEDFSDWYYSPEYQSILKFRLAGADCDTVLVKDRAPDRKTGT